MGYESKREVTENLGVVSRSNGAPNGLRGLLSCGRCGFYGGFGRLQHGLRLAGELAFRGQVEEHGFQAFREVVVADLDLGGGAAEALEYRLYGVDTGEQFSRI